ncbi:MAG: hypothetical protein ABIH77_01330 [Pseudomonadota bacterium]
MKKRHLVFGFLALSILLVVACKPKTIFNKQALAGHWVSKEDQLTLKKNGKISGKFLNKSMNDCIWSIGDTLAGAENTKNTSGEYFAIICKKENRVYAFHIDAFQNNQLILNYVIWGKRFVFEGSGLIS